MKDKIILFSLFLFALFFFSKKIEKPQAIDSQYYYEMAEKFPQLNSVPNPFKYRILAPLLARFISPNLPLNFFILSVVTILTFIFLFYHYLLRREIKREVALLTIFFILFNKYQIGCFIFDPYRLNEIFALLFILLFFYGLETKNFFLLFFSFSLGVLAREAVVLLFPVALFNTFKEKEINYLFACLPGLGIFIFIRLLFKDSNLSYLVNALFDYGGKIFSLSTLFRLLINSFAPLTLIPIGEYKITYSYLKTNPDKFLFFLLILFSSLFGKDNERLMAPAFIFFYPLIGEILTRKVENKNFLFLLGIFGFLSAFHHYWNRFPVSRELTILLSFLSLLSVTLTYYFIGIRHKERY